MYLFPNQPPLSPSDIYGGITTPALGGLGAVTNAQIAQFVAQGMAMQADVKTKAQMLVDYMKLHNLTPERVALATGYSVANVNDAIAKAGPQGGGLGPLLLAVGAFYLFGG